MRRLPTFLAFAFLAFAAAGVAQQTRIASDFEIAQMERQLARSRDFLSQVSGRLNLGDLRASRNEMAAARDEYAKARDAAARERAAARTGSNLTRYATATAYAGLAEAKSGRDREAFELLEEALRYASDDAEVWNLYSSAMRVARRPAKAIAAARNAVAISEEAAARTRTLTSRIDLAVHRYALASALIDGGGEREAERLFLQIVDDLRSSDFAPLARQIARSESFEIYSSARGEAAAYLSLLNRAQLRLGAIYESRGDRTRARTMFERVLASRSDDPAALTAMARLARSDEERERFFADAFEANPFSQPLIAEYERHLARAGGVRPEETTAGAQMRLALQQIARGELRSARATIEGLLARFPANETLKTLASRIEGTSPAPAFLATAQQTHEPSPGELRQILALLAGEKMTPEQRAAIDRVTFVSMATMNASSVDAAPQQTIFESGTIAGIAFRFPEPTAFAGAFEAGRQLRLTYRVLGLTELRGADALLLEPLRLEAAR